MFPSSTYSPRVKKEFPTLISNEKRRAGICAEVLATPALGYFYYSNAPNVRIKKRL